VFVARRFSSPEVEAVEGVGIRTEGGNALNRAYECGGPYCRLRPAHDDRYACSWAVVALCKRHAQARFGNPRGRLGLRISLEFRRALVTKIAPGAVHGWGRYGLTRQPLPAAVHSSFDGGK